MYFFLLYDFANLGFSGIRVNTCSHSVMRRRIGHAILTLST